MESKFDMAMPVLVARQQQQGSNRGGGSNSLTGMVWTLIPTFLVSIAVFILFLLLSRRIDRVYQPRSYLAALRKPQLSPKRTPGLFGWLKEYSGLSDDHVLGHSSIDNYLWLRMFKMLALMCFVGCLITWPVLFPVNATGGGGQSGLDILSFSNITPGNRYYAQALVAWAFLSWVIFMITRETIYVTKLRQQYLASPFESSRISTRTVLFTNVPEEARSEEHIRREYAGVRTVWLVNVPEELAEEVDDRDTAADKLEVGETKLLQNFVKRQLKNEKKNKSSAVTPGASGEQSTIDVDKKDRPTHRLKVLKFLPFGKKVDTVEWSRDELKRLIPDVSRKQQATRNERSKPQGACFVEFETVQAAYAVFQKSGMKNKVKNKVKMTPAEIGTHPDNVIWKNTIKSAAKTRILNILATAFVWFLCIFWSIPVAVIGAISNINYLTENVPFLRFINSIPPVVLGAVTGLLPVVLLAVLMALVPIVCGILARMFEPTEARVQMKVQGWYFPFQVIQVFLVTTFASGAASVASQIVSDPTSAVSLLAENLPKASNFYISYFILFGLMSAAMQLLQVAPLLFFLILGKILDKTPRKMYNRYVSLGGLGWGALYPKFTNLGVIALAYSSIAPLILGFATVGFTLLYLAFRYSSIFTLGTDTSTRGESYNRALFQLTTGLYISELCLIGLFGIGIGDTTMSIGPLVLMVVFLVGTILWHIWLKRKINKLNEEFASGASASQNASARYGEAHGSDDVEKARGLSEDDHSKAHSPYSEHPTETHAPAQPCTQKDKLPLGQRIKSFFAPTTAADQTIQTVWPTIGSPVRPYTQEEHDEAYVHPAITNDCPIVWIPRDKYGLSTREIAASKQAVGKDVLNITDEEAWFNEKGKIDWRHEDEGDLRRVPIWEQEPVY